MRNERPVTRVEFESAVAAVRRAITSGQWEAGIPFADTELALRRSDEGGYTLHGPDNAASMSLFAEPAAKPNNYPEQLPFVAGEFVTTEDVEEPLSSALWWAPLDANHVLLELHEQSVASGWTLENEMEMPEGSVAQRVYFKPDLQRLVLAADGAITLIDRERAHRSAEGGHCQI